MAPNLNLKAPGARSAPEEFLSIYSQFNLISDPRAAKRVFGPAWRAFTIFEWNEPGTNYSPGHLPPCLVLVYVNFSEVNFSTFRQKLFKLFGESVVLAHVHTMLGSTALARRAEHGGVSVVERFPREFTVFAMGFWQLLTACGKYVLYCDEIMQHHRDVDQQNRQGMFTTA